MSTAKTALIIGASRGLGLGLVQRLLEDGWQVTATVRNPHKAEALQALGKVQIEQLDMDDQQAVIALSQQLKGETFDLLFVNAGVKGPDVQTPGGATIINSVVNVTINLIDHKMTIEEAIKAPRAPALFWYVRPSSSPRRSQAPRNRSAFNPPSFPVQSTRPKAPRLPPSSRWLGRTASCTRYNRPG